ncbi:hypothetical protein DFH09DRAFT_1363818 [Mycena vulgaris]|nr:hypothetical protein DFH09DRAFT_1363818 [Mycena vulgaris]
MATSSSSSGFSAASSASAPPSSSFRFSVYVPTAKAGNSTTGNVRARRRRNSAPSAPLPPPHDPITTRSARVNPVIDGPGGLMKGLLSQVTPKSPLPTGELELCAEGTLFVPQETNSSHVIRYQKGQDALEAAADRILELYPNDPSMGSPFSTGNETFDVGIQYKRYAAVLGDFAFKWHRQSFSQYMSAEAQVLTFLYKLQDPSSSRSTLEGAGDVRGEGEGFIGQGAEGWTNTSYRVKRSICTRGGSRSFLSALFTPLALDRRRRFLVVRLPVATHRQRVYEDAREVLAGRMERCAGPAHEGSPHPPRAWPYQQKFKANNQQEALARQNCAGAAAAGAGTAAADKIVESLDAAQEDESKD